MSWMPPPPPTVKKRPPSPPVDPRLLQRPRTRVENMLIKAETDEDMQLHEVPAIAQPPMGEVSSLSRKRRASPSLLDPRPARRSKYDGDTVKIKVGPFSTTFNIHEALLSRNSYKLYCDLFRAKEKGEPKELSLPHEDPDDFRLYVGWLYDGSIQFRERHISGMDHADHAAEWTALSRFYVLAEKLGDWTCCNAVMEAMISKIEEKDEKGRMWYPADHNIKTLYDGTEQGSPARAFLVQAFLHAPGAAADLIPKDDALNHVSFLADLARAFLSQRETTASCDHLSSQKKKFLRGS